MSIIAYDAGVADGRAEERDRILNGVRASRTQLAGLAGIGNAVLVEELLVQIIENTPLSKRS